MSRLKQEPDARAGNLFHFGCCPTELFREAPGLAWPGQMRRLPWNRWESMPHVISLHPTWDPNVYGFKKSDH